MAKHLRIDGKEITFNPNEVLLKLGVTWQHQICSSLALVTYYFNCENVPEVLPEGFTEVTTPLEDFIGYGLSKKDIKKIKNYVSPPEIIAKQTGIFTTTSCQKCLFYITDVDYDSAGLEYYTYCSLIKKLIGWDYTIGVFSEKELEEQDTKEKLNSVLENCPLKTGQITVKLDEKWNQQ